MISGEYKIRKAVETDYNQLEILYNEARGTIASLGIDQWQNGYPDKKTVMADIESERMYVLLSDNVVSGAFVLISDGEPTYDIIYDGNWKSGDTMSYIAIHRVAVSLRIRGKGASGCIMRFAEDFAKNHNRKSLRIDTHEGNVVMRKMLENKNFEYCGIIFLESGEKRVAYEKLL